MERATVDGMVREGFSEEVRRVSFDESRMDLSEFFKMCCVSQRELNWMNPHLSSSCTPPQVILCFGLSVTVLSLAASICH